jgi:hypothetical protein
MSHPLYCHRLASLTTIVKPVANLMNRKPLKVKSRSVNPYAKLAFGGWLNGINWSFIYNLNSCEDCFFPVRMVKLHATDKPWVTPDFKDLVQKRQKAFLSTSCNYPELRNRVNKMANRLKANFFDSKVRGCDHPKKWWSLVKKTFRSTQEIFHYIKYNH